MANNRISTERFPCSSSRATMSLLQADSSAQISKRQKLDEVRSSMIINELQRREMNNIKQQATQMLRTQLPHITCSQIDFTPSCKVKSKQQRHPSEYRLPGKRATLQRKHQREAKNAFNDLTRSVFQSGDYHDASTSIDMTSVEEEIFGNIPSFVSEPGTAEQPSMWSRLINFFHSIAQSGADFSSAIAAKMPNLMEIFSGIYDSVSSFISSSYKAVRFFQTTDWKLIVKILILLVIYTLGYVLNMFPIATIVASLYGFYAFDTAQERLVPVLISAASLWKPASHITSPSSAVTVNVHCNEKSVFQNGKDQVIPTVMTGAIALLAAACMGKFTFFQDAKVYDDFITRLDKQSRAWSALYSLSDKITDLAHKAMSWIGLEQYGFADDLSQALPQDVEQYVAEVKYFSNGNVLNGMVSSKADCERALALFSSLAVLQVKYRTVKPISDVVNRFAGFVYKVFNHANISNPQYQKPRDETVCVFLQGGAGTGKTKLVYLLALEALKMKNVIKSEMSDVELQDAIGANVYSRSAQQVYWDGYRGQHVTVVDDFGQVKDSTSMPNIEYDELIRISNSFPYNLHMARLEEKASSYFSSCLYIATTNLLTIKPPSLTCAEAVHRRINFAFNVTIKPEFRTTSGRVKPEIANGALRTDIYEFRIWDPANGQINDQVMSFEDIRQSIAAELRKKQHQGKSDMSACISHARSILQAKPEGTARFVSARDFGDAELNDEEHAAIYHCADKSIAYCIGYLSDLKLPKHAAFYIARAKNRENTDQVYLEFNAEEHLANIRATNSWMASLRETFNSLWAMINFKSILAVVSLCALAYSSYRVTSDIITYRKEKEDDFPTESDGPMWQRGIYRAKSGQDAGSFKYRQFLPEWYGNNRVYDLNALRPEDIEFEEDDRIVPRKEWCDKNLSSRAYADLFEDYKDWIEFKSQFESGKSRGKHPVRNRVRPKPPIRSQLQSWNNENAEQIADTCARNARSIQVVGHQTHQFLMTKDREFVMNKHIWQLIQAAAKLDKADSVVIRYPGAISGTTTLLSDIIIQPVKWKGEDIDLVKGVLPSRQFACARDITPFIVKENELAEINGKTSVLTTMTKAGLMQKVCVAQGAVVTSAAFHVADADAETLTQKEYTWKVIKVRGNTVAGDCGGFYITDSKDTRRLFGLHSSGAQNVGYAVPLFQEMFDTSILQADDDYEVIQLLQDEALLKSGQGNVDVIGRRPPVFANVKSKIVQTQIFEQIIPTTVAPAKLDKPLRVGGPALKAVEKQFGPVYPVDKNILETARMDYLVKLSSCGVPELRVLTFDEATRGIPGTDYFKPINRSRSAGYPWCLETTSKGKTKWFGSNEWEYNEHTYALEQKINADIEMMSQGQIPEYIFVDTLKDETRPIEKVLAGKTRVFAAADMAFIIVFRMYFLSFIVHMMRTRIENESAVGIRCQSGEWTDLYHMLKRKGSRVIAGDFSNYDGSLNPEILWAVYDVIDQFHADATEQERQVRKSLWYCLVNSKHLLGDILYQLNHSQPSGNPSTAILNTMYNSIACRYTFFSIYQLEADQYFDDYVSMIAYGDDNVLNVSPLVPEFTQESMAKVFATFGMTYTDETKTGVLRDKTLEEVGFLKRGFAFDEDLGKCFCPLTLPSILECFNWVKKSDNEGLIMDQLATTSYVELAMHPPSTFHEYAPKIRKALQHYGIYNIPFDYNYYRYKMALDELITRFPGLEWA